MAARKKRHLWPSRISKCIHYCEIRWWHLHIHRKSALFYCTVAIPGNVMLIHKVIYVQNVLLIGQKQTDALFIAHIARVCFSSPDRLASSTGKEERVCRQGKEQPGKSAELLRASLPCSRALLTPAVYKSNIYCFTSHYIASNYAGNHPVVTLALSQEPFKPFKVRLKCSFTLYILNNKWNLFTKKEFTVCQKNNSLFAYFHNACDTDWAANIVLLWKYPRHHFMEPKQTHLLLLLQGSKICAQPGQAQVWSRRSSSRLICWKHRQWTGNGLRPKITFATFARKSHLIFYRQTRIFGNEAKTSVVAQQKLLMWGNGLLESRSSTITFTKIDSKWS